LGLDYEKTAKSNRSLYYRFNDKTGSVLYNDAIRKQGGKSRKGKAMMKRNIALSYLYSYSSLSLGLLSEGRGFMRSYRDSRLECNGFQT